MTTPIVHNKSSALRVKKFKENMTKKGFKRVQKWVYDLESKITKDKMKADTLKLRYTSDDMVWDEFAFEQLSHIEGWKQ